jgi:dipeptidyl aminopeptidase/acylaminoacyl peptidase
MIRRDEIDTRLSLRLQTLLIGSVAVLVATCSSPSDGEDLRDSVVAEGVPPIPPQLDRDLAKYRFARSTAQFQGWLAGERKILIQQESGGISQAFLVDQPGGEPSPLTQHRSPVAWSCPSPTRDRFVFASDNGGDENNHLYLFDLETNSSRRFANGRWMNHYALWSHSGRQLALSSNARNGKDIDLYVVNPPQTATGRCLKEVAGLLYASSWSPDDKRIAAVEILPDYTKTRVHLIDVATGEGRILPTPSGRPRKTWGVRWSLDGGSLFWATDRDSEYDHLAKYDLATDRETSLTGAIPRDVDDFALSDDGSTIVYVTNADGLSSLHVLNTRTGEEQPAPRFAEGIITSLTFRPKSREFAFEWECSRQPSGIYSYDLNTGRRTSWVEPTPCSPRAGSVEEPMLVHFPSFDGRMIPAFVRRPHRRFPGRRPVLIDIHGGPYSQHRPHFSGTHDYLIGELGLAVIAPNVRGSTGYGRDYEKLDNGSLREDAVRDIGSLLDWIASQPDMDASRVAVSGGSYGGYMALATLVRYGDRLRAGIDWMGVSDFETFMKSALPSFSDCFRDEYGDEREPEVREFFGRISPLRNAAQIRRPLLVVHGSNDPRVKAGESERIVAEVRKNGTPVWSIRFEGEGHGIEQREHKVYFQHSQVLFIKRYLLGEGS